MGCDKPYGVVISTFKSSLLCEVPEFSGSSDKPKFLYLDTPCRKCHRCLKNRQRLWSSRARTELKSSSRTWLGTLTINPHQRFIFSLQAGSRDYHRSARIIGAEVTKFLKKLRKAKHRFRYVLVMEAHKDGYPHVHLLLHEVGPQIPKRELQKHWKHGFSNWKLADKDARAAHYVTKYLAKDMRTRVRASQRYGRNIVDIAELHERMYNALRLSPRTGVKKYLTPLDTKERDCASKKNFETTIEK